jgi:tetratricopeptide (TPR) repeat protein
VVSGVIGRHDWAIAYRDRAHTMARDVNELTTLAYIRSACGVYEVGAALWQDAEKGLQEANEIDTRIGDMRHLDESMSILELARLYQCDLRYGIDSASQVLDRATQRKDVLPQIWALCTRGEMVLRRSAPDTLDRAVDDYNAALKLLEQNIDLANDIRVSGALALAYWRMGEPLRALDLAAAAVKKSKHNPTAPYSIEGYAGVAEVFLQAWQNGEAKHRPDARKACKVLKKFAAVFPLGGARHKLYQGWFDWLDGKPEKARAAWEEALREAEKLNLNYEQGRALMFLGRYAKDHTNRAEYLSRALEIFEKFGVHYEAEEIRMSLRAFPDTVRQDGAGSNLL